jgi:hypothetical protein
MEAFSDGVLAIIITIMVLELAAPHEADLAALFPLAPVFLSYVRGRVSYPDPRPHCPPRPGLRSGGRPGPGF